MNSSCQTNMLRSNENSYNQHNECVCVLNSSLCVLDKDTADFLRSQRPRKIDSSNFSKYGGLCQSLSSSEILNGTKHVAEKNVHSSLRSTLESHLIEYEKIEHFEEDVQHEKSIEECFKVIVGRKDGKVVSRHSRSVDRMLNEAAQFAEAVGEKPSSNFGQILREIIEDESDSTDDEDRRSNE
mmetsp:Transcript_53519/g.64454  ORF Transcript_53519/g.64454 Transcript_53519/m.64454 type:complete len:183 (+) Transcript_53519:473-1021(+)